LLSSTHRCISGLHPDNNATAADARIGATT
jgi:hypothetical protein